MRGVSKKGVVKLRNDPMEPFKQMAVMAIGALAVVGGIAAAIVATDGEFGSAPDEVGPSAAEEPEQNETAPPDVPDGEVPDLPGIPDPVELPATRG